MFSEFRALKTVNIDKKITLQGTNPRSAQMMFVSCSSLTEITGLNNLDTSNATSMASMFNGCSSLKSLDLSGFDTAKVTDMTNMFDNCSSLETLTGLSGWNTSNVTGMEDLFLGCGSLTSLDLEGWNTEQVTAERNLFYGCTSLRELSVGPHFRMKSSADAGSENIHDPEITTGIWVSKDDTTGPRWEDDKFIKLFENGNAAGTYIWKHLLIYNANGGTGTVEDPSVYDFGTTATLKTGRDIIKRNNATFIGWSTNQKGLVTSLAGEEDILRVGDTVTFGNHNITVYAVWAADKNNNGIADYRESQATAKRATVTFNINGGDGSKDPNHPASYKVQSDVGKVLMLPHHNELKWTKTWEKEDGTPATYPAVFSGWSTEPVDKIIPEDDIDDLDNNPYTTAESTHLALMIRQPNFKIQGDTTFYAVYAADENGDGEPDFLENANQVEYYANGGRMIEGGWLDGVKDLFYRCGHHHVANETVTLITLDRANRLISRDGAVLIGWSAEQVEYLVTTKQDEAAAGIITTLKMPAEGNAKVYAVWAADSNADLIPDYSNPNSPESTSPQTGDNSNLGVWLALAVLSLTAIAVISATVLRRKEHRR